ncbi:hypothetical protein JCM10207_008877 [Rhodosporidiobolus poonsookiae]
MAHHTLLILAALASLASPALSSASPNNLPLPPLAGPARTSSDAPAVPHTAVHAHLSRRRRSALSHDPTIEKRQVHDVRRAAKRWEKRDEIELARRSSPSNVPSTTICQGTVGGYQQCGGLNYNGDTCCTTGWTCTYSSEYYSQCLPAATSCTNSFYSQCGGIGFSGSTCCPSGSGCVAAGDYYSACIPGASSSVSTTAAASTTSSSTTSTRTSTSSQTTQPASSSQTTSSRSSSSSSSPSPSSSSSSSSSTRSITTTSSSTTTTSSRTTTTSTTTTTTKTTTTTTSASPSATCASSRQWAQCGGSGYSGATCCPSGYYCSYSNAWYSQCIPGSDTSSTATTTTTTSSRSSSSSSSSSPSSFSTVTRSASTTSSASSAPSASASSAPTCSNAAYAQCGGLLFLFGESCCPTGYTCEYSSLFYSQCLPSAAATSSPTSSAPAATSTASTGCKSGGSGSDGCTPYTVTALGVTLPSGVTWKDGGHVNYQAIPKSQYVAGDTYTKHGTWSTQSFGVHFESLNNQPSGVYIGKSFYDFSGAAAAFPSGYCITWVQVDVYNQHFGEGGQTPICT